MNKVISRYTMPYRIFLLIGGILLLFLSPIGSFIFYRDDRILEIVMYGIPVFIFGWFAVISSFCRMIIITDEFIEKQNIKNIRIEFDEITLVKVYYNQMEICSEKHKIPITKDCENYKKLMALVLKRVVQLPNVEIQGKQSLIEKITTQW